MQHSRLKKLLARKTWRKDWELETRTRLCVVGAVVFVLLPLVGYLSQSPGREALSALAALGLLMAFFASPVKPWQRGLQLLSLFLMFHYADGTPFHVRTYDVNAHVEHLRLVGSGRLLPGNFECWECFQPPLYYWIGALCLRVASAFVAEPLSAVRLLSMVCMILFQEFSLRLFRKLLKDETALAVATLGLLFWPSLILHAARITNDVPFYCLALISVVLAIQKHSRSSFAAATLAIFTKSTGLLLFLPLALANSRRRFAIWASAMALAEAGLLVAKHYGPPRPFALLDSLRVQNTPWHMFGFDLPNFLTHPFYQPFEDSSGRQYFGVALLKTAVWGEWNHAGQEALGIAVNALVLALLILGVVLALKKRARQDAVSRIAIAIVVSHVAALFLYRIVFPFGCNNDFRFIFVMLPFAIGLFARSLEGKREVAVRRAVLVAAFAFATLGSVFLLRVA